jgi:cytochrome c oxidase cbb3-type subunit 3
LIAIALLVAACEGPPSAGTLTQWTPRDHDHSEEQQRILSGEQAGKAPKRSAAETLAEATWGAKCINCHGPIGQGDGPMGPQVKAPDLTRDEWQARVSDQDIAATIRNGKGQMPAFSDIGDAAVGALVQRIRKTRGMGQQ